MSADDATTAVDGPAPSDRPVAADASPEAGSTSMFPGADESADGDIDVDDGRARHLRPKRRNASATAFGCPVCGVTLRPHELQQHWQLEVGRLHGIARNVARRHRSDSSSSGCVNGVHRRRESLSRVRSNRQRRRRGPSSRISCPVCHRALEGSPDELAEHVDRCLARTPNDDSMDEEVDVDGTGGGEGGAETFDEYEWAGQSRLRATALLEGGYRAAGWVTAGSSSIACRSSNDADDDDADLDVDGDDADTFGRPQFSEADLIPLDSGEPFEERERRLLRQAVLSNQDGVGRSSLSPRRDDDSALEEKPESPVEKPPSESDAEAEAVTTDQGVPKGALSQVVNSLRERLRQMEEQNSAATKCLICMEPYIKPVVSVCCWHVHCQDCWLKTLGAKKLCPQCNSITGASDLRRIYL